VEGAEHLYAALATFRQEGCEVEAASVTQDLAAFGLEIPASLTEPSTMLSPIRITTGNIVEKNRGVTG